MGRLELQKMDGEISDRVPDNLLPMALRAIQDSTFAEVFPLIGRSRDGALVTLQITAAAVRTLNFSDGDFEVRTDAGQTGFRIADMVVEDAFLGPPLPHVEGVSRALPGALPEPFRGTLSVLGLIDTGIAFWNPAFARAGLPVVERLSFVEYRGADPGKPDLSSSILSATALQHLADMGRGPGGDARLRAELGARFPDSVHAPFRGGPPAKPAAGFSHGTAMLDILLRNLPEQTRVVAVELPAEVLADASGGALESVLEMAVDTMAQQMIALRDTVAAAVKGTVLLPFAFLGGPHDGSRASVRRLGEAIANYRKANLDLTLVVPMGNHLDDRVHARLESPAAGMAPSSVAWRLLPDDHSSNTVELLHAPGEYRLSLTCPDGDGVEIDMSRIGVARLLRDGLTIGAVWTAMRSGWMRTRITLAPTAQRTGRLPLAPAGAWRLTLVAGAGLDAWILRDDATLASRAQPPLRQSFFDDPSYQPMRGRADPLTDDPKPNPAAVRRQGTASLLATGVGSGATTGIEAVGATWSRDGQVWQPAVYSGRYRLPMPGDAGFPDPTLRTVDRFRPAGGWAAAPEAGGRPRGTAGERRFAVSGTSVAAALRARELVDEAPDEDAPA